MQGEEWEMDNSDSEHELVIIEDDDDENAPPTTPESERPTQPPPLQRNISNVFTPIENVSESFSMIRISHTIWLKNFL